MASKSEQFLISEGWVMASTKKQGCFKIVRWSKPGTEWQNVSQGVACQVARNSKAWAEQQAELARRRAGGRP